MLKRTLTILLLFSTVLVSVDTLAKEKDSNALPPTIVKVITAKQKEWQATVKAIGSLSAIEGIDVNPEIPGRVINIYFKSGQYVKKGQPIIQLYSDIIKASLESAKAQLKLSKVDFDRFFKLYKQGFYSKADLDKATATRDSSQSSVDLYEAQLSQTLIKTPFAGKLGLRKISIGDFLSAGEAIVSIEAVDPIRIDFSIPEVYIEQIKIGDEISIKSHAFKETYKGKIYAFNSIVDTKTRSLDMRASIPNKQYKLIPGTFIEVTVYFGDKKNLVVVPQNAIVYSPSGNYVYRMIENKAVKTPVKLGKKIENNEVIILEGLKTGDVVITEGQLKLYDGSKVITEQKG